MLFAVFILLQIADIWTAHTVLKQGGREMNPLLARLFVRFGHLPVLWMFKAVVVRLFWRYVLGTTIAFSGYQIGGEQILIAFCGLYLIVVLNNFRQIMR
jgi:hypothetical protein